MMSDQLVLSTVGIKRQAAVREQSLRASDERRRGPSGSNTAPAGPRRVLTPTSIIADGENPPSAMLRTTVRLDGDLARKLDRTAREAGVSVDQLAIATLEQALSSTGGAIRVRDLRPRGGGTTNRKLRLPRHLRERADAISARAKDPRAARSRLINNAIRRGLPDDPRLALALVIIAATAARAPKSS